MKEGRIYLYSKEKLQIELFLEERHRAFMESGREAALQAPGHSVGVPGEFREGKDITRRQSMLSGGMKSRTPADMLYLHLLIHSFSTCVLNTCTISGASVGMQNNAQSKVYCPQDAATVVEEYENKLIDNHKIYRMLNKEYYERKSKAGKLRTKY